MSSREMSMGIGGPGLVVAESGLAISQDVDLVNGVGLVDLPYLGSS